MVPGAPLTDHLAARAAPAVVAAVLGMAEGVLRLAALLAAGGEPDAGAARGTLAATLPGDAGPTCWWMGHGPEARSGTGAAALAIAPLLGAEAGAGVASATLFSVLSMRGADAAGSFLQPGHHQLAAGYALYGARTVLALAFAGEGGVAFFAAPPGGDFRLTGPAPAIPAETDRILADAGTSRGWDPAPRALLDQCMAGADGPRGRAGSLLATGSPVADLHALLTGGGLMLRPSGGPELPRLHLAQPIALLVEAAGGAATDGRHRLLDAAPNRLDETVPLVCGAAREVARLAACHDLPLAGDSPLFGRRGLFRI